MSSFAVSLSRRSVCRSAVRLVVLVVSLAVAVPASAADEDTAPAAASTLDELAFVLGTFFPQVDGVVTNVRESGVEIDRGSNQGVRPGLVLSVSRVGTPFRHPLTGVILGASETAIGVLVIESATDDHAVGRFIRVPAAPASAQASDPVRVGDRVRLGEEPLPVALASTAVSQVVTDRFRTALEGTGRFHLLPFTPSTLVPALIECGGPCGEISESGRLTDSAARTDAAPSSSQPAPSDLPAGRQVPPTPQAAYAAETKALAAAARAQGADYLIVFDARLRPVGAMGAVLIMETREGRTVDAAHVPLHLSPDELPVSPPPGPSEHAPSSLPGSPTGFQHGAQIDPHVRVTATYEGEAQVMVLNSPTVADKVSDLKELFSSQSQLLYYVVPQPSG